MRPAAHARQHHHPVGKQLAFWDYHLLLESKPSPVPGVTLALTGDASGFNLVRWLGELHVCSYASGGSYTVTPSRAGLAPGSASIDTVDVIATQRHFLNLGTPLSGCRLTAADVNGINGVDTIDVIAIQRFFLGFSTGIANTGKWPIQSSQPELSRGC